MRQLNEKKAPDGTKTARASVDASESEAFRELLLKKLEGYMLDGLSPQAAAVALVEEVLNPGSES